MKAIICNKWCKPEELKILEVASPKLEVNSVRIDVHAAGVNFPDVLIIQGKYQYKYQLYLNVLSVKLLQ